MNVGGLSGWMWVAILGALGLGSAAFGQVPQLPQPGTMLRGDEPRAALKVCPPSAGVADCGFLELDAALAAARPGDKVVLAPGFYTQGAVVAVNDLTIRGEPGAHLGGHPIHGKAALVVTGDRVTIEGIECSDIEVPDQNGACIRAEGDDLTIRNVNFHDNENGILSGPGGGTLTIENSRFERNGRNGRAHSVYVGATTETFIFKRNVVLSTKSEGHGIKSRALVTIIEANVIASLEGDDSRAIDIPNGGEVIIRDNIIEKGPNSRNDQMIGLALEGDLHPINTTIIEQNIFIFDAVKPGLLTSAGEALGLVPPRGKVINSRSPGDIILRNNTIVRAQEIGLGGSVQTNNRIFRKRKEAGYPPFPWLPQLPHHD